MMKKARIFGILLILCCVSFRLSAQDQTLEKAREAEKRLFDKFAAGEAEMHTRPIQTQAADTAVPVDDETSPELIITDIIRKQLVDTAKKCLGAPYVSGGITPAGFDCSGLIYYTYLEGAGIAVPRSTRALARGGENIALEDTLPGDILLFSTVSEGASHAGIVIENDTDGIKFIHAASQGKELGVIISNMNENYYKTRFIGARRYLTNEEM